MTANSILSYYQQFWCGICWHRALQPSPRDPATAPPSLNQYGRQQDCRLKCPIGFPQQASTHQHEILCQQPTSQPELAYAQEAPTLPFTATPMAYGQKAQYMPDEDTSAPLLPECIESIQKFIRFFLY